MSSGTIKGNKPWMNPTQLLGLTTSSRQFLKQRGFVTILPTCLALLVWNARTSRKKRFQLLHPDTPIAANISQWQTLHNTNVNQYKSPHIPRVQNWKSITYTDGSAMHVKKLASKLHVLSVNFAANLVHTRRALSSTVINSHQEPVSGQACNPLDPHWCFFTTRHQSGSFSLINVGSGFTACIVFFPCKMRSANSKL